MSLNSALFGCFEKKKFWVESQNITMNFSTFSVGGCWGQPMLLFWKLIHKTQMSNPPEAASYRNSTKLLILLPLRAIYFYSLCYETPCNSFFEHSWWGLKRQTKSLVPASQSSEKSGDSVKKRKTYIKFINVNFSTKKNVGIYFRVHSIFGFSFFGQSDHKTKKSASIFRQNVDFLYKILWRWHDKLDNVFLHAVNWDCHQVKSQISFYNHYVPAGFAINVNLLLKHASVAAGTP